MGLRRQVLYAFHPSYEYGRFKPSGHSYGTLDPGVITAGSDLFSTLYGAATQKGTEERAQQLASTKAKIAALKTEQARLAAEAAAADSTWLYVGGGAVVVLGLLGTVGFAMSQKSKRASR